jgi:site-specific DNA-methyltransferase (adenine-specific)
LRLEWEKNIDSNTISLWKNISEDQSGKTKTSITLTEIGQIIDWKIYNCLINPHILNCITSNDSTALKPAVEPIILAQAPLEGTYAENVLKWGCGALNIDGCRIGGAGGTKATNFRGIYGDMYGGGRGKPKNDIQTLSKGRWPANFLLSHSVFCEKVGEREVKGPDRNTWDDGASYFDGAGHQKEKSYTKGGGGKEKIDVWRCVKDCPVRMLDEQSGETKSGGGVKGNCPDYKAEGVDFQTSRKFRPTGIGGDKGGASRFFYCAKASRSERNAGLEELNALFEKRRGERKKHNQTFGEFAGTPEHAPKLAERNAHQNNHPTVKPIALLRYLCRLVTPPNGIILDPFAGSGSTGCGAVLEGFDFTGIEKEKEYVEIAEARIKHWTK